MALRQLHSVAHDDDDLWDMSKGMPSGYEPPEFPPGLIFGLNARDLAAISDGDMEPGATMRFAAMGEVTSVHKSVDCCRIELCVDEFADEDGHFKELDQPAHICLCERELEKMDLDTKHEDGTEIELGDTIHLVGTARLETVSSSEWGEGVTLQIVELGYIENESQESREG